MPIISALFSFTQGTYGWTEKWFRNITTSFTTLNDYYQDATTLLQKRMYLCAAEVSPTYIRLSREDVEFDSLLFPILPGKIKPPQTYHADSPDTCVLVMHSDVTRSFRKISYLRGIPDDLSQFGGLLTVPADWNGWFGQWTGELISKQWGWMARQRPVTVGQVSTIIQNEGFPLITSKTPIFAGFDSDVKAFPISVSKLESPANLNGPLTVSYVSDTSVISLKKVAILPYTKGGLIRVPEYEFIACNFSLLHRIGERKAGRPYLQPRGRAKNRTRG